MQSHSAGYRRSLRDRMPPPGRARRGGATGVNLKFFIDLFVVCVDGDTGPTLDKLAELAASLSSSIDEYREVLDDLVSG